MKIDTEGTYTLRYTAEDECGNIATADRTVVVEAPVTYRTVLYTDGTLIINEKSSDIASNVALHGAAMNVYIPFDPNGATTRYEFGTASQRPWDAQSESVLKVEFGDDISPTNMDYWFQQFRQCGTFDYTRLDSSHVTTMRFTFLGCKGSALNLGGLDTSNVTNMQRMFSNLEEIDLADFSSLNTSNVTNMSDMFARCSYANNRANLDLTSFDTRKVTNMGYMFEQCYNSIVTLDLSSFSTPLLDNTIMMFYDCQRLRTIYVSPSFDVSNVTRSTDMFGQTTSIHELQGGAGTAWSSSNPTDKTYAHIDGGTSNPGYFTARS